MRTNRGVCWLVAGLLSLAASHALAGQVTSIIVLNNTVAIPIKSSAGVVTGIDAFANSATPVFLKLYDAASQTCGTGTPRARYEIVANANGSGFVSPQPPGDDYINGIVACITGGIADGDTTAPAGATYIVNVHWR